MISIYYLHELCSSKCQCNYVRNLTRAIFAIVPPCFLIIHLWLNMTRENITGSLGQEISGPLWKPNVHYRINKTHLLCTIISHWTESSPQTLYYFRPLLTSLIITFDRKWSAFVRGSKNSTLVWLWSESICMETRRPIL